MLPHICARVILKTAGETKELGYVKAAWYLDRILAQKEDINGKTDEIQIKSSLINSNSCWCFSFEERTIIM